MADDKAIDNLAKQLPSFHISARMQRLAAENDTQNRPPLNNSLSAVPEPRSRPATLTKAPAAPRKGSPDPRPGRRPVWEPPLLDYSWFEQILQAEKEMNITLGSKDIAWRTDMMSLHFESLLLRRYRTWLHGQARIADTGNYEEESKFWYTMGEVIEEEVNSTDDEYPKIKKKHGKNTQDLVEVVDQIRQVGRLEDPHFII